MCRLHCLPAHPFTNLFTYPPAYLATCLPTYLSELTKLTDPVCLHNCLSTQLSSYTSVYLSASPSVYLPSCLSTHLSVYTFFYPSVTYLPTHLCTYVPIFRCVRLFLNVLKIKFVHVFILPTHLSTYPSVTYLTACLPSVLSLPQQ